MKHNPCSTELMSVFGSGRRGGATVLQSVVICRTFTRLSFDQHRSLVGAGQCRNGLIMAHWVTGDCHLPLLSSATDHHCSLPWLGRKHGTAAARSN